MNDAVLAVLSVVAIWWLSTALVLRVVWLPARTHRYSIAAFSVLAVAAIFGVIHANALDSVGGAYLGFGSALALWAWHELTFLLGVVSGPRKEPCDQRLTGWPRFWAATATVIHHELVLAATALALVALSWGGVNRVAAGTFLVLWVMRLSAKLNIFLGVPNLSEEFVPKHLRYLSSYFRRAPCGPSMLLSLGIGAVAMYLLIGDASSLAATRFETISNTLVAAILGLGLLEHVFLAFPLPDAVLWRWLVRSRPGSDAEPPSVKPSNAIVG